MSMRADLGELVEGTGVAVAVDPDGPLAGVLLRGLSGAGKSDLALRLIEQCPWRRTCLVADDLVIVGGEGDRLAMRHPGSLAGKMEARGFGIIRVPFIESSALYLVAEPGGPSGRLPEFREEQLIASAKAKIPVSFCAFLEPSAPAKIRHILRAFLARHFDSQRQDVLSTQEKGQQEI
ncbi:MAG: hypothetical protein MRY72_02395 [Aquisalinus sp.]|nr:hypothetical protein [Aquisalinus sp.]